MSDLVVRSKFQQRALKALIEGNRITKVGKTYAIVDRSGVHINFPSEGLVAQLIAKGWIDKGTFAITDAGITAMLPHMVKLAWPPRSGDGDTEA